MICEKKTSEHFSLSTVALGILSSVYGILIIAIRSRFQGS